MAKVKEYRRFIRINGALHQSPRFLKKKDADLWYEQMKRQKQFATAGFKVLDTTELTFLAYSRSWLKERVKNYPEATWKSDEQRLRAYLLPELADMPINQIGPRMIRDVLKRVTSQGQSVETRTRVKALASKIFSDAFNEEIIPINPVHGVKFSERRQGRPKPKSLTPEDAAKFINAASELDPEDEFIALCGLFLGLRKSEILGLKDSDFDFANQMVRIRRRLEQASLSIKEGTKSGQHVDRIVPIPAGCVDRFKGLLSKLNGGDFLLKGRDRAFMSPRTFHDRVKLIAKRAQIEISSHGLRHTFGREFVRNGGNIKALQAIFGHSASTTTDRYSNLDGQHVGGTTDIISYGVKSESQQ